jgi:hypothetical protein
MSANDLVIPKYVTDGSNFYKITKIDSLTFNKSTLTGNLTFPDSITQIGTDSYSIFMVPP